MSYLDKITQQVFVVAELSANHCNDYDIAVKTFRAIAKAGADAVKIQTYKPSSLSINVDNKYFGPRKDGLWKGYSSWDLYKEAAMPYEWQPKLKKIAEGEGLIFFSSPFDKEGVDFLEDINIPLYKIASLEINDLPLIRYVASKGKPVIISTGAANLGDIEKAVGACREVGNEEIALLKCTSDYPATIEQANLSTIPHMKGTFKTRVGVSDHTKGATVPVVSVAFGASIIEKHFILDRSLGGPDASFSMEPEEFSQMVDQVRQGEKAIGTVNYTLKEKDKFRRRSLFVTRDMQKGEGFSEENVRSIRPGYGLDPEYIDYVITKRASRSIKKGTPLSWDLIK